MSSPITKKQLNNLSEMIREWPIEEKLKWSSICEQAEGILGYIPTRQALSKKPILVNAYKIRKSEIKSRLDTLVSVPSPKSMPAAIEQIVRLKQENERLKAELNLMAETAQRFIYNASLHGLSKDKLMKPLPKINREK
ncbi:hypothetical protein [Methylophaga sp.]|uniref:hypothetical protein n=1 Tax=Methylophaga sp. TaxID=2024840 RepID=UPI0023B50944